MFPVHISSILHGGGGGRRRRCYSFKPSESFLIPLLVQYPGSHVSQVVNDSQDFPEPMYLQLRMGTYFFGDF